MNGVKLAIKCSLFGIVQVKMAIFTHTQRLHETEIHINNKCFTTDKQCNINIVMANI